MKPDHRGIGMTSQRTRERLVQRLRDAGIRDLAVLDAIRTTPRHLFIDEALNSRAYEDTSLPIGYGQTISQPYVVARMTEALLANGPLKHVLEVGTGCGYQTAILARMVENVFSVERIWALQSQARIRLRKLDYRNIRFSHTDGTWGWSKHMPYDGIVVTAAPDGVPQPLLEQLAPQGRLIIPVGPKGHQELLLIRRSGDQFVEERLDRVSFVPLLGGTG